MWGHGGPTQTRPTRTQGRACVPAAVHHLLCLHGGHLWNRDMVSGVTSATQEGRQEQWGGLTEWGRQGLLAEDLLVQLLCLLVLVLFQVG